MIDKNYRPPKWVVGLAVEMILSTVLVPSAINKLTYFAHQNCSKHCVYKRQILRGELRLE